jgi:hypothetical protein
MANEQNPRTETTGDAGPARVDEQATGRDRTKKLAEGARARADSGDQDARWDRGPEIIRASPSRPQV